MKDPVWVKLNWLADALYTRGFINREEHLTLRTEISQKMEQIDAEIAAKEKANEPNAATDPRDDAGGEG